MPLLLSNPLSHKDLAGYHVDEGRLGAWRRFLAGRSLNKSRREGEKSQMKFGSWWLSVSLLCLSVTTQVLYELVTVLSTAQVV